MLPGLDPDENFKESQRPETQQELQKLPHDLEDEAFFGIKVNNPE